ncbi:ATP-binding protein [candidate division CSSED10-310 bacterium]|uniref:ATP-binding protein n=1 Tax=candidate division CSSED10-310 bacterium TaxID=2855610 RepID=A0ABV6YRD8_UNCC1
MLEHNIRQSLLSFPVVGILGSRQAGKTTLAKQIISSHKNALYLDLELPSDMSKLGEAELYLGRYSHKLVVIDEIQQMPELFPLIRALIDKNRIPGRFLILGSASPDLIRKSSQSLAGRIVYHELSTFLYHEVCTSPEQCEDLWIRGGYPDSFSATSVEKSFQWREAFIRSYLERDLPQLGIRIPALQLRRFWTMLAHSHGQIFNASKLAASMGLSAPTVRHYLDILTDTFIIRQILPYHTNIKKRYIKSPKVYIRDSGLLHTLLNILSLDELSGNPILGHSWEGYIIEQIICSLPERYQPFFLRTNAGAEVDLIILKPNSELIAIEVKYSSSPKASRGFVNLLQDLKCSSGIIIYPGEEEYPIHRSINVTPLNRFLAMLDCESDVPAGPRHSFR